MESLAPEHKSINSTAYTKIVAVLWREERLPLLDSSASASWPSVGQRWPAEESALAGPWRQFPRVRPWLALGGAVRSHANLVD
jgi:hypothetical protein